MGSRFAITLADSLVNWNRFGPSSAMLVMHRRYPAKIFGSSMDLRAIVSPAELK
jgi:hypothetical protein